jgi:hypothetical protein
MIAKLEWMLTREKPAEFGSRNLFVYEVILKTSAGDDRLEAPENACRVLQSLLMIKKMLGVDWLNILMWKGGLYLRLKLGRAASLLEILAMIREKSTPPGDEDPPQWEDEPTWVRMVAPEHAQDTQQLFREKVDSLLTSIRATPGETGVLFLYQQGQ